VYVLAFGRFKRSSQCKLTKSCVGVVDDRISPDTRLAAVSQLRATLALIDGAVGSLLGDIGVDIVSVKGGIARRVSTLFNIEYFNGLYRTGLDFDIHDYCRLSSDHDLSDYITSIS